MLRIKLSFFAGFILILGMSTGEAANLHIINHTIFSTHGNWLAKAIIKINNRVLTICPKESTECPNEKLIKISANKIIKVQVTKYVFGNGALHIDMSCSRDVIAKHHETVEFNLFGSPSNNIGFGSNIFCSA